MRAVYMLDHVTRLAFSVDSVLASIPLIESLELPTDTMGVPEDQKEPMGISSAQSTSDTHVGVGDVKVTGGGGLERRAEYETQRGLSPRHVQLMAIGGSIGTGLFVGIGSVLSQAGPLSLVLGYLFWGILFVWPCYLCVAEMCTFLPIRGTIFELASRFVDPALGFAMGWTYFFAGTMLVWTGAESHVRIVTNRDT